MQKRPPLNLTLVRFARRRIIYSHNICIVEAISADDFYAFDPVFVRVREVLESHEFSPAELLARGDIYVQTLERVVGPKPGFPLGVFEKMRDWVELKNKVCELYCLSILTIFFNTSPTKTKKEERSVWLLLMDALASLSTLVEDILSLWQVLKCMQQTPLWLWKCLGSMAIWAKILTALSGIVTASLYFINAKQEKAAQV